MKTTFTITVITVSFSLFSSHINKTLILIKNLSLMKTTSTGIVVTVSSSLFSFQLRLYFVDLVNLKSSLCNYEIKTKNKNKK